MLHYTVKNE